MRLVRENNYITQKAFRSATSWLPPLWECFPFKQTRSCRRWRRVCRGVKETALLNESVEAEAKQPVPSQAAQFALCLYLKSHLIHPLGLLFFNSEVILKCYSSRAICEPCTLLKSLTGSLKQSLHPIPVYNQQGFGTVHPL
ncbi:hypothetical protein PFLUV_G00040070 [Scomber scombrus]|uniref:Uncharacterized protein n=1 Tax=Scomber scombrus TaxID=13677 RepID=A0AAV1NHH8_SCOSC